MTSPLDPRDTPEKSLAEYFAEIEAEGGGELTAEGHRAIVAAVRADREQNGS